MKLSVVVPYAPCVYVCLHACLQLSICICLFNDGMRIYLHVCVMYECVYVFVCVYVRKSDACMCNQGRMNAGISVWLSENEYAHALYHASACLCFFYQQWSTEFMLVIPFPQINCNS